MTCYSTQAVQSRSAQMVGSDCELGCTLLQDQVTSGREKLRRATEEIFALKQELSSTQERLQSLEASSKRQLAEVQQACASVESNLSAAETRHSELLQGRDSQIKAMQEGEPGRAASPGPGRGREVLNIHKIEANSLIDKAKFTANECCVRWRVRGG